MKAKAIIKEINQNRIKAQIYKISRKNHNELYVINCSEKTKFFNCDINTLKPQDNIEITFNGAVALSLPPQIYANKIRLLI